MSRLYNVVVTYQIKKEDDPRHFSQNVYGDCVEEAKNKVLDALRENEPDLHEVLDVWAECL